MDFYQEEQKLIIKTLIKHGTPKQNISTDKINHNVLVTNLNPREGEHYSLCDGVIETSKELFASYEDHMQNIPTVGERNVAVFSVSKLGKRNELAKKKKS